MGLIYTKVRVYNPADRAMARDFELLVDSGAVYSVVREDKLKGLGMKPEGRRKFKVADGRVVEHEFGIAIIECKGESAGTVVIFGEVDDTEVLGVHALEGLGLELDPVTKELKPMILLLV